MAIEVDARLKPIDPSNFGSDPPADEITERFVMPAIETTFVSKNPDTSKLLKTGLHKTAGHPLLG